MFTIPFNFILIPTLVALFFQNPVRNIQRNFVEIQDPNSTSKLNCELMDTTFKRGKGLMFISKENARCMFFDFKKDTNTKFYSPNVQFDVQIYFLDKDMKVVDENTLKTNSFKLVGSREKYRYVLEIPKIKFSD